MTGNRFTASFAITTDDGFVFEIDYAPTLAKARELYERAKEHAHKGCVVSLKEIVYDRLEDRTEGKVIDRCSI